MPRPTPDRNALLDAMADHVLAHGLNTASLRPLAKAAGTSDRMLIYHFTSKDDLVALLLERIAGRMAEGLAASLADRGAMPPADLLRAVVGLLRVPEYRPFGRVWFDILSMAAADSGPHVAAAGRIIAGFLGWLEARLDDDTPNKPATARALLTVIEGVLVLDVAGQREASDTAVDLLARGFDRQD